MTTTTTEEKGLVRGGLCIKYIGVCMSDEEEKKKKKYVVVVVVVPFRIGKKALAYNYAFLQTKATEL
jgi:hypothetical protein